MPIYLFSAKLIALVSVVGLSQPAAPDIIIVTSNSCLVLPSFILKVWLTMPIILGFQLLQVSNGLGGLAFCCYEVGTK